MNISDAMQLIYILYSVIWNDTYFTNILKNIEDIKKLFQTKIVWFMS